MIIGNGLIATTIKNNKLDSKKIVFFASGVSNYKETRECEFKREEELLNKALEENKGKLFIYFSSCSVLSNKQNEYTLHKKKMENRIRFFTENNIVFRLPQVVGNGGNPNTLLNYLVKSVKNGSEINVFKNTHRNFIDIDDILNIVKDVLIEESFKAQIINVAYPENINVLDALFVIERFIFKKANYTLVENDAEHFIDISSISHIVKKNEIMCMNGSEYLSHLLSKYYAL